MTDLWRWVEEVRADPLDELTVVQLGRLRTTMLAALAQVEEELHHEMRLMRENGATQVDIMAASQYRSIDAVRKILDPAVRDKAAAARKRGRGERQGVAA